MLKFIPGILVLQAITIALVLIVPEDTANWAWLRLALPLLIAGLLTAFWFGSIAARQRTDEISRLKENHAKERETIRVKAERSKTRMVKQAQRKTLQEVRRASTRANVRMGLAFAGAVALGGLLVLTQFMSLGLLILTTAGGGLGGYLLRIRQEKRALLVRRKSADELQIISESAEKQKQIPRLHQPPESDKKQ